MTHDFELVAGVFEAARHLSGAARAAFLEERCEGNDGLLQEVQSLLSHGDADDGLSEDVLSDVRRRMSQVALQESAAAPLPTEVALPKRIGPYAVVRRLGAGGMGVVYEALQESPSRSVAVKVLRPLAAGESMLRRFEREGEILARLRHPGIAQIYATGTCDLGSGEQPYLAMELIEGSALNAYVKSQGLDTPGVVRLFAELCRALHHAHTQGVVHRDLKPENVLVEADGRPRILDFGIAHVIGHDERVETLRTADGDVIGTLDYMAPEQVRPGLEGRAPGVDVHAVGVMLFEQLSGGLPRDLTGLSIAAAIHRIAQDEPLSLAALAPSLPRDVAWVIDRAVASEPSRRYGSALALADELDRLVRREPVLARPPSRLYRVERFVRRNRLASLGLSVAAVSLVAGLAVSVVQSQEARAAAAEARSEARKAAAINEFILERMLGAFSPLDLGRDVKVADVLDLAAPEIDLAFCDQPDVAAAVSSTLGRSYFQLGLFDEARALLERAHRDLRRLKGPVHRETLQAADSLFGCLYQLEQREQARTLVRESLESIDGSPSASTPEAFQLAFAEARLVFSDGDRERGMALALAAYEGAAATYPNGEETLEISYGVAVMQSTAGETEAAMARVESYLAGLRRVHGPRNPREVLAMGELAFMYMRLGRSAESIEIGREAAKRAQADFGRLHPTTIFTVAGLSSLLGETNQLEDALGLSSECHKSSTELLGAKHRSTLRVRSNHAILLRKQGELDSAMAVAEECLADRLEALGPLDPEVATSYDVLAAIQMELRRYDDADDSLKRALDIAVSAFGDVAPEVADILYNRASLLSRKGEAKEAEKMFRELHRVELEIYGTEHPFPVLDLYQVGRMLVQQDRPEEALPILSSVLESQRRLLDPTSPDLFRTMAALGHCHLLCEHPEEAERLLAKALRAMNEQRLDELIELTRVKEYLEVARQAR